MAPGGPLLVGSFQSWNLPGAVASRKTVISWGSWATASFSRCTKALADDDSDGIFAALLAHDGSCRMLDVKDALSYHQAATLDLPAGSYESLA